MKKNINMSDIALALNMSRNTVSKAFNNQYLPERTKTLILNKAIEMGYKNLDIVSKRETVLHNKNILILTTNEIKSLNFFLSVIRGIDSIVSKYELNLFQYQFDSQEKINAFQTYCYTNNIKGILCLETFSHRYSQLILKLNIPVVFIDSPIDLIESSGNYDIVLMENINSVQVLCSKIIKSTQIKKMGYVGDYSHCLSFHERFMGFRQALFNNSIHYSHKYSITQPDEFPYGDTKQLAEELSKMPELPECFFCANDFLAISLINSLKLINKRVPEDIQVIGFDNTSDAKNYEIPLTTIDTDKELLGKEGIVTLLNRIKYGEDKNKIIHLKTSAIIRSSTK